MSESSNSGTTPISKGRTIEELADFWGTHSLADYEDDIAEVEFEIRAKPRHRITLDPDVFAGLQAEAHLRGVSPETLVNLWLAERLQNAEK
jgi:hypothetical protein